MADLAFNVSNFVNGLSLATLPVKIITLMRDAQEIKGLSGFDKKKLVMGAVQAALGTIQEDDLKASLTFLVPPLIDTLCSVNKDGLFIIHPVNCLKKIGCCFT